MKEEENGREGRAPAAAGGRIPRPVEGPPACGAGRRGRGVSRSALLSLSLKASQRSSDLEDDLGRVHALLDLLVRQDDGAVERDLVLLIVIDDVMGVMAMVGREWSMEVSGRTGAGFETRTGAINSPDCRAPCCPPPRRLCRPLEVLCSRSPFSTPSALETLPPTLKRPTLNDSSHPHPHARSHLDLHVLAEHAVALEARPPADLRVPADDRAVDLGVVADLHVDVDVG